MPRTASPFTRDESVEQGKRVKRLREKTHLSRLAFCKKHAIPVGSMQTWEEGTKYSGLTEFAVGTILAAFALENIFCTREYLLYGKGEDDDFKEAAQKAEVDASVKLSPIDQLHKRTQQREINKRLMIAIAAGRKNNVLELVKSSSILQPRDSGQLNLFTAQKNSPLHEAVIEGRLEIIAVLVEAGANVNYFNCFRWTPLHLAVIYNYREIIYYLINAKADIEVEDLEGNTALALACRLGHSEVAEQLIKQGAKINVRNHEQYTPLHWAAFSGEKNLVSLLLERGADPTSLNVHKETPFQCASKNGYLEVVQLLDRVET